MHAASIDYSGGVSRAWSDIATFVPKLIGCLIILLVGYFIAKAVEKILDKILQKTGFDTLVERGGVKKALAKSKYDAASILGRVVFYAIMLVVLSVAFGVFGSNPVSGYLNAAVAYLPKVFVAILIVIISSAIAAAVKSLLSDMLGSLSYGKFLAGTASAAILVLGIVAALDQLQIARNVVDGVLYAALAAIVGVVVVAVGGGGIEPMRGRWQNMLTKYDQEKAPVQQPVSQPASMTAPTQAPPAL